MAELRPLQQEALEPLRKRWVHGDPPGSGKTPVGLTWLREHGARRCLIVSPSNVVRHWAALAPIWHGELDVLVAPKGSKLSDRQKAWDFFKQATGPAAYITTYALLREDADALAVAKWDAAIFDEAHRLKNRTSLLHKAAAKVAHRTPLLDLSTGSAIMNSAEEAWSALHLMDPRRYKSFWRWAREHFDIEETTFHGTLARPITRILGPKPGALEAIAAEFGVSLVARSEEEMLPALGEPDRIFYEIDLTPAERRVYDSLEKHGWAVEGGERLITPNALAKNVRLRQLASDWSSALGEVGTAGSKVIACAELIEDLHPKQVLVFVSFKRTAQALVETLHKAGVESALFTGDEDEDQREEALDLFVSGEARVLIGTYGALAEGTDGLQYAAHHVVLLDHDWVPEIERQAIGRLRRDGQQYRVVVHDIFARDTIDEVVAQSHAEKIGVADTVLGRAS